MKNLVNGVAWPCSGIDPITGPRVESQPTLCGRVQGREAPEAAGSGGQQRGEHQERADYPPDKCSVY